MTNMNGYLPTENGVEPLEQKLIAQFEAAQAAGSDEPVQVVVVGIMDVASVRHRAKPSANPPILSVKLSALEVVEGRSESTVRLVLAQLKSARHGEKSLDGMDEALMELIEAEHRSNTTGDSTASRDPQSGKLAKPDRPLFSEGPTDEQEPPTP